MSPHRLGHLEGLQLPPRAVFTIPRSTAILIAATCLAAGFTAAVWLVALCPLFNK